MRARALLIVLAGCRLRFDPIELDDAAPPAVAGCPAFAIFCDDFETGDLTRWPVRYAMGSMLAVDGARIHGGTYALDTAVGPNQAEATKSAVVYPIDPQSSGTLAARAWFSTVDAALQYFNSVLMFDNVGEPLHYSGVMADDLQHWIVSESSAAGLLDHTAATLASADTWTCVELDYDFAPPRVRLYIDDATVLDDVPNDPAPRYHGVEVGIARSVDPGLRVFADDVVIAHQHIGCD